MFRSISHSLHEAYRGAFITRGMSSRYRIAADYILSRLLRFGKTPGYNAPRCVQFRDVSVHYRFNRGDLQSIREVWMDECYKLPFPFHPKTILDLGANIGMASLWFQERYHPHQLLAVECDPDNAAVARLNFLDNQLPGEVLEAAAGATSGEVFFQRNSLSNLGTITPSKPCATSTPNLLKVPMFSMSDLIDRFDGQSVDLIKMDIEGAEGAILSADIDWINQTRALIIEWHDDRVDSTPLIEKIIQHGFKHYPANTRHQANLGAFLRA